MTQSKRIMLYGATGFTAGLMIEQLQRLPCELVLAGRNANTVEEVAQKHGASHAAFALDDPQLVERNLEGIDLVVNCAGPFTRTAHQMVSAALATNTSYFDITGELSVFMSLFAQSELAKSKHVTLIPGLGFDIAPSDCLAALLALRVNKPHSLKLAISTKNTRVSHGTLKTVVFESKNKLLARRDKGIQAYDGLSAFEEIDFNGKKRHCIRAPLGDLLCAHLSTQIPNIDTFVAIPKNLAKFSKFLPLVGKLSKFSVLEKAIEKAIEAMPNGPTTEQQQIGSALIFGEVIGANGVVERGVMKTKEPYVYTADLMVAGVKTWIDKGLPYGFLTPSQAFGAHFAEEACKGEVHVDFMSATHQHVFREQTLQAT